MYKDFSNFNTELKKFSNSVQQRLAYRLISMVNTLKSSVKDLPIDWTRQYTAVQQLEYDSEGHITDKTPEEAISSANSLISNAVADFTNISNEYNNILGELDKSEFTVQQTTWKEPEAKSSWQVATGYRASSVGFDLSEGLFSGGQASGTSVWLNIDIITAGNPSNIRFEGRMSGVVYKSLDQLADFGLSFSKDPETDDLYINFKHQKYLYEIKYYHSDDKSEIQTALLRVTKPDGTLLRTSVTNIDLSQTNPVVTTLQCKNLPKFSGSIVVEEVPMVASLKEYLGLPDTDGMLNALNALDQ